AAIEQEELEEMRKIPVNAKTGDGGRYGPIQAKYKALKDAVRASNPVLFGSAFARTGEARKNPEAALRSHLETQARDMREKLNQARGYWHCLDKNTCSVSDLTKFLKKVPLKFPPVGRASAENLKPWMAAQAMQSVQDCIAVREGNDEAWWGVVDFASTVGSAAAGGVGFLARGARVAWAIAAVDKLGDTAASSGAAIRAYRTCMAAGGTVSPEQTFSRTPPSCTGSAGSELAAKDSACTDQLLTATMRLAVPFVKTVAAAGAAAGAAARAGTGAAGQADDVARTVSAGADVPPPAPAVTQRSAAPSQPRAPQSAARTASYRERSLERRNARVRDDFKDIEPIKTDVEDVRANRVEMTMAGGSRPYFFQNLGLRRIAEQEGRIFTNKTIAELPRGKKYTGVILDNGEVVYGQADNAMELGVKHFQLANGRGVVSAFELEIPLEGAARFNVQSGTYSKYLIRDGQITRGELERRTQRALQLGHDRPIQVTRDDIISEDVRAVSRSYYLRYCENPVFRELNPSLCEPAR
ncbi:MAG TPA: hypothetical protein VFV50_09865, partial [Bdellovibrionales bacterium]|nr:hypothetical protein [Bdellovibrionales bacterium]